LTRGEDLGTMLQNCCAAVVRDLDAARARVWTLNSKEQVLELEASAGLETPIDETHGRVPVGQSKIGKIALDRKPHWTNHLAGDPRIGDQALARREGMVSFAGYPLLIGDRLVGVLAMYARKELPQASLDALGVVADSV